MKSPELISTSREGNVPGHSVNEYIKYKNFLENKYPKLHTEYKLITIDGVDGCGKSYFSEELENKLKKQFGDRNVINVDITHFKGSLGQEKIGKIITKNNPSSLYTAYMASINRAYNEVIWPALEEGKFVIVTRSELNLIRYVIEHIQEDPKMMENEIETILSGAVTHKLFAGNRIFIQVSPEEQLEMLGKRKVNSKFDPTNIEEAKKMCFSQNEMFDFAKAIPVDNEANFIEVKRHLTESKEAMKENIRDIVNNLIIPNLKHE